MADVGDLLTLPVRTVAGIAAGVGTLAGGGSWGEAAKNDLIDRLARDARLGMSKSALQDLIAEPLEFAGAAQAQVRDVVRKVNEVCTLYPQAAAYAPAPIL